MQNPKAALIINPSHNIDPKPSLDSLVGFDVILVSIGQETGLGCSQEIVYQNEDLSLIKKDILKRFDEPILFLNSYEKISSGRQLILEAFGSTNKAITFLERNTMWQEPRILVPEARLFGKFGELLEREKVDNIPGAFVTYHSKPNFKARLTLCKTWFEERQHDISAVNHLAYAYLSNGDIANFIKYANEFIHKSPMNPSSIMMRYNLARTKLFKGEVDKECLNYMVHCLAAKPDMAEFWCLAAEYQLLKQRNNFSKYLFENAIVAGSCREHFDGFPIIINAYKKYPELMISRIEDMEKQVEYIAAI